ncbi:MAG: DNA primase, partial [Myxococcota bacterium]
MIPDEKIAEIRERTDIVALVRQYVPLKRMGKSWKGLCPFHSEKTPSFYVHPDRQFFYCFGCQAAGDPIRFLMQIEGIGFPEATRTLAERAGIELPNVDDRQQAAYRRAKQRTERQVHLMEAAAGFYVKQLDRHPLGAMAKDAAAARGLTDETVAAFRLGYAPLGWDATVKFLAEKGFSPAEATELGLIVPRRNRDGHYDRFRHRLMFPISDPHGRIVAFSGRILDPPPDEPLSAGADGAKYLNSPEGPLFKKSEVLFGLYEGRVDIRREGKVLLCEGNFDLVALHQAGFKFAVAPLGTSFTAAHAKLLRRYAGEVILLFDGDSAGRKATRAAAPLLREAGLKTKVVALPEGADPDTFLREKGADALKNSVEAAPGIIEHLIDESALESAGDASAIASSIEALGPVIAQVGNPVEANLHVERVARKFGVSDLDAVRKQLRRGVRAARANRSMARKSQSSRRADGTADQAERRPRRSPKLPPLEAELVGAMLDNTALFQVEEASTLQNLLTNHDLRAIFQVAAEMVGDRGNLDGAG